MVATVSHRCVCVCVCNTAEKVTSLGKDWHRPCLRCERCSKTLAPGSHAEVRKKGIQEKKITDRKVEKKEAVEKKCKDRSKNTKTKETQAERECFYCVNGCIFFITA